MEQLINSTVKISPVAGNQIEVECKWVTYYKEHNGGFVCRIPAFDISFAAQTEEMIEVKATALIKSIFDYHFKETKNGLKSAAQHINSLGFTAT